VPRPAAAAGTGSRRGKKPAKKAKKLLEAINADIDVDRRLGELTVSQQQMVQIAAAVGRGARVIIFDEPTSSLSQHEAESLFVLIRRLQSQGRHVHLRFPPHQGDFLLCDTITVLRDGRVAGTLPTKDMTEDTLVELMIGRKLAEYFPAHLKSEPGKELLRVENFHQPWQIP